MKASLTAALSLSGVLVAGSAAALVNSQVLQSSSPARASSPIELPTATTVGGTLPTGTQPQVAPASAPAPAVASTQAVYQIGDAGLVTIDTAGDVLTIVSVVPNPGWTVVEQEQDDAFHLEVKFQAGTVVVEFHANYLFGVVGTSVEAKDLAAPASTSGSDDDADDSAHGGSGDDTDDDADDADDSDDSDDDGDDDHEDDDDEGDDD